MSVKKRRSLAYILSVELGTERATTLDHIIAIDGVEHLLTLVAVSHQAELLEDFQVVGNCSVVTS